MFYKPQAFMTPLHIFAQEHREALQNAALLLGGRPYVRRVENLIADLKSDPIVTPRVKVNALALHSLFSLGNVHDFDCPEAAYFANLDPEMPVVEEICLLTDGLTQALLSSNILPDDNTENISTGSEFADTSDWSRV